MDKNNHAKCQLKKDLGAVSFAMDELRLFLDTHPNCKEALMYFNKLSDQRSCILEKYQQLELVEGYSASSNTAWNWIDSPWPWEVC